MLLVAGIVACWRPGAGWKLVGLFVGLLALALLGIACGLWRSAALTEASLAEQQLDEVLTAAMTAAGGAACGSAGQACGAGQVRDAVQARGASQMRDAGRARDAGQVCGAGLVCSAGKLRVAVAWCASTGPDNLTSGSAGNPLMGGPAR